MMVPVATHRHSVIFSCILSVPRWSPSLAFPRRHEICMMIMSSLYFLLAIGVLPSLSSGSTDFGDWSPPPPQQKIEDVATSYQCPFLMDQWNAKTLFFNATRRAPTRSKHTIESEVFVGGPCANIEYNHHTRNADKDNSIIKHIFQKYHQSSIYFVGDSMSLQHFVSFACKLSPITQFIEARNGAMITMFVYQTLHMVLLPKLKRHFNTIMNMLFIYIWTCRSRGLPCKQN